MRFLDIAVAILIGTAGVGGLIAWSPAPGDAAASSLQARSAAREFALRFIESKGVAWFVDTPPPGVCAAIGSASDSTYGLSASAGDFECAPPPAHAEPARLTFQAMGVAVTVIAWSTGQG